MTKRTVIPLSASDLRLRDSVVYFAQRQDGAVKIGTTTNLAARMQRLRSSVGEVEVLGSSRAALIAGAARPPRR